MSRMQELLTTVKEKSTEFFDKIKESELYQKLDEKYNSLSPRGQKITRYAAVVFFILLLLFYPLSHFSISKDLITEYESKRDLIRDMFKTYRESSGQVHMPLAPSSNQLIDQVKNQLNAAQLLPQQIRSISSIEPEGKLIPKNLVEHVVSVELSDLNLRQTVEIGTQLANISTSIKLKDLSISANPQRSGYFDVVYKIYAFNIPQPPQEAAPDIEPVKGKKNKAPTEEKNFEGANEGIKE